jgi:hypothetical protein
MICSCIDCEEIRQIHRDILGTFNSVYGDQPGIYNDWDRQAVIQRYGETLVALILDLYEKAGWVEHSGNLLSSAHLTREGVEFRKWVNVPFRFAVPQFAWDKVWVGAEFDEGGRHYKIVERGEWVGWLCYKHPDGQWVSLRKLTEQERDEILKSVVNL